MTGLAGFLDNPIGWQDECTTSLKIESINTIKRGVSRLLLEVSESE